MLDFGFFVVVAAEAQDGFEEAVFDVEVIGDLDVVEDGKFAEQTDILEGAGDAALGDLVWLQPDDAFAVEFDFAFGRVVDTGKKVEGGGFAGAVGADEADEFALLDGDVEGGDGAQAAEGFGQVSYLEQGHAAHLPSDARAF